MSTPILFTDQDVEKPQTPAFEFDQMVPANQQEWFTVMQNFMGRVNHLANVKSLSKEDQDLLKTYDNGRTAIITISALMIPILVGAILVYIFVNYWLWSTLLAGLLVVLLSVNLFVYTRCRSAVQLIRSRHCELQTKLFNCPEPSHLRYYLHSEMSNAYYVFQNFLCEHGLQSDNPASLFVCGKQLNIKTIQKVCAFFKQTNHCRLYDQFFQYSFQTQFNTILDTVISTGFKVEAQCQTWNDLDVIDVGTTLILSNPLLTTRDN